MHYSILENPVKYLIQVSINKETQDRTVTITDDSGFAVFDYLKQVKNFIRGDELKPLVNKVSWIFKIGKTTILNIEQTQFRGNASENTLLLGNSLQPQKH